MAGAAGVDAEAAQTAIDQEGEELPAALVMLLPSAKHRHGTPRSDSAEGVVAKAVRRLQR